MNKDDIYNHFKKIGSYKDHILSKDMDLVQDQLFNDNYDAWDEGDFSDDDTAHLIGADNS